MRLRRQKQQRLKKAENNEVNGMQQGRRPIIIGIVGDSAAGKTTISRGLVQLLLSLIHI